MREPGTRVRYRDLIAALCRLLAQLQQVCLREVLPRRATPEAARRLVFVDSRPRIVRRPSPSGCGKTRLSRAASATVPAPARRTTPSAQPHEDNAWWLVDACATNQSVPSA